MKVTFLIVQGMDLVEDSYKTMFTYVGGEKVIITEGTETDLMHTRDVALAIADAVSSTPVEVKLAVMGKGYYERFKESEESILEYVWSGVCQEYL